MADRKSTCLSVRRRLLVAHKACGEELGGSDKERLNNQVDSHRRVGSMSAADRYGYRFTSRRMNYYWAHGHIRHCFPNLSPYEATPQ